MRSVAQAGLEKIFETFNWPGNIKSLGEVAAHLGRGVPIAILIGGGAGHAPAYYCSILEGQGIPHWGEHIEQGCACFFVPTDKAEAAIKLLVSHGAELM